MKYTTYYYEGKGYSDFGQILAVDDAEAMARCQVAINAKTLLCLYMENPDNSFRFLYGDKLNWVVEPPAEESVS